MSIFVLHETSPSALSRDKENCSRVGEKRPFILIPPSPTINTVPDIPLFRGNNDRYQPFYYLTIEREYLKTRSLPQTKCVGMRSGIRRGEECREGEGAEREKIGGYLRR